MKYFGLLLIAISMLLSSPSLAFTCSGNYDKNVVFIGDSISSLPGSFPELVAATYPEWTTQNFAIGGTTSVDWSPAGTALQSSGAINVTAETVVILLGTNDAWSFINTPPADFISNIQSLALALQINGNCRIIIMSPPQNYYETDLPWKTQNQNIYDYSVKIKEYCSEPYDRVVCGPVLRKYIKPFHLVDRLHPNSLGHQVILGYLGPVLSYGWQ